METAQMSQVATLPLNALQLYINLSPLVSSISQRLPFDMKEKGSRAESSESSSDIFSFLFYEHRFLQVVVELLTHP